jgi:hypothetical protein
LSFDMPRPAAPRIHGPARRTLAKRYGSIEERGNAARLEP